MRQNKQLHIRIDGEAWISTRGMTGLRYQLNEQSWQWILNYLQTGDYEDFGIFPSGTNVDSTACLKALIEKGYNIARIPFLRETEVYIKLLGLFRFGKLFFSIRRDEDFTNYLNDKGL